MEKRSKHVLVIDIDAEFLIAIERLLEDRSFYTTTTWDVSEALDLLAAKQFELVLIGHHPPEVHASVILQHTQGGRKAPSCLVIQATRPLPSDRGFFLSQGAKGIVCKWHHGEIVEQLEKCLPQGQSTTEQAMFGRRAG